MKLRTIVSVVALLAACAASAFASAPDVQIANARARATAPGQTTAVVYMDITSHTNATLVTASSPLAERVEVHSTTMDGGVMRMRPLPKLELKAGKTVRLAPNGTHLMLVNVKRPIKAGETVPVTLNVQSGKALTSIVVQAPVASITEAPKHHHH